METSIGPALTSSQDRALTLLGQGISPEQVASAIGVTPAYISQLVSDPVFAEKVFSLRYAALAKHNERDNAYDKIEDRLIEKLEDILPMMMRPLEVLKAISIINAAKRRGSSAPTSITNTQTVLQLIMPTQIINTFTKNSANQVIKAGDQELITMQSGNMERLLKSSTQKPPPLVKEINHVLPSSP